MKPRNSVSFLPFPSMILAGSIAALIATQPAAGANLYWDSNGATPGAGATPAGVWSIDSFWSTDSFGSSASSAYTPGSDVVFSAGADATGTFIIGLTDTQDAASLTFEEGTSTVSGTGGVITLSGTGGKISVNTAATIGNNTTTILDGTLGLTKLGAGALTLSGSAVNTVTGGLTVTSGTLTENFGNLATPTNLIDATNVLTLDGNGTLALTAKNNVASSQTFASTTLGSGSASKTTLTKPASGVMTVVLGAISRTTGSLLNFSATPDTTNIIATTANSNTDGILGPWATVNSALNLQFATVNGSNQIVSYAGATATTQPANLSDVTDATANYSFAASATLTGPITANTLRNSGAAITLANAGNSITLNGLIATASTTISGTGNIVIGATQELSIYLMGNFCAINSNVVNNPLGPSKVAITINGEENFAGGVGGNSYTGGTTISGAGQMNYNNINSFGTGPISVNGFLRFYPKFAGTVNNALTLNGLQNLGGGVTWAGPITLIGIIPVGGEGDPNITGNISGAGGLSANVRTVTLSGINDYTGTTAVTSGTLVIAKTVSLYNGDTAQWTAANLTANSGANLRLNAGGTDQFTGGQLDTLLPNLTTGVSNTGLRAGSILGLDIASPNSVTVSANVTDSTGTGGGAWSLRKLGTGTLILGGTNSYTGKTFLDNGALSVTSFSSATDLGSGGNVVSLTYTGPGETTAGIINLAGTTGAVSITQSSADLLKFTSAFTATGAGAKTLTLQGSSAGSGEIAGAIVNSTGTTSLIKTGSGTWTLSGANTHSGTTTISNGMLVLGNALALQNSAYVTTGSTGAIGLDVTGYTTPTFGGLGGAVNLATAITGYGDITDLKLNPLSGTVSYSGTIVDGAAGMTLTKTGAGTQALTVASSYTGMTTVSGGALQANDGVGLPTDSFLSLDGGAIQSTSAYTFTRSLGTSGSSTFQFTGNGGGFSATGGQLTVNIGGVSDELVWGTTVGTNIVGSLQLGSISATAKTLFENPIDLNGENRTINVGANTAEISGLIQTTSGTAGLIKTGAGTLLLTGANTFDGLTTVSAGGLSLSGANGAMPLSASPILLIGGSFTLDNSIGANNNDRLSDTQAITLSGGGLVFKGSTTGDSSETIGAITQTGGYNAITVTYGGSNMATLTAESFIHSPGNAATLVNGTNLGKDTASTTSVGRFFLDTAPTPLVGSTAPLDTGIDSAVKDTQIVPFVVGEATVGSGGLGTQTGTANTFLTYETGTGFRPLNPTNEFTSNAITAGTNTRITGATTAAASASINSLVIAGADLSIADGQTLTTTSGALLFAVGNTIKPSGTTGILDFGSAEAMMTMIGNGTITTKITGSGGLTKTGPGILTLNPPVANTSTYTGKTSITSGTVIVGTAGPGLKNAGVASPLGAPTGADATIDLYNSVTLQTGSTSPRVQQETDRTLNLAGTGPGTVFLRVNDNDTAFTFGAVTASGTGAKLLDITMGSQGNGDREMLYFNGNIGDVADDSPLSLRVTFNTAGGSNFASLKAGGTFTGPITLVRGTTAVPAIAYLSIGGALTQNGGLAFTSVPGTGTLGGGNYAGNISLDNTTVLYYNSSVDQILTGVISGAGSLTKAVSGSTLTLANANTYTGATSVTGGALVLNHATAISGGIGTTGGTSALTLNGGVLGLGADDFTRSLAAAGTVTGVNFTGNGGWAAYGADRLVNLGGASDTITWATANTGFNAKVLMLGASTSTHTVEVQNPIDLGSAARTVQVDDGSAAVDGVLSGDLSGVAGGNLLKTGLGTLSLRGTNGYAGTTNVNAGTLLIDGANSGVGTVNVAAVGRLGGNGSTAAPVTMVSGGKLLLDISDWSGAAGTGFTDLDVASLALTGITWTVDISSATSFASFSETTKTFPFLTASGDITGFDAGNVTITPGAGFTGTGTWSIQKTDNTLELVYTSSAGTPYDLWATSKFLTVANNGAGEDPDKDGRNNLAEFAFNGDPLSGADNGRIYVLSEDSDFDDPDAQKELILTVAVRAGTPAFTGSPSPTSSQDGISYTIEGSLTLGGFATAVNVVPTPVTIDGVTPLPAAGAGYEYRSFSLSGSNGLPGAGFLRAKVTQP